MITFAALLGAVACGAAGLLVAGGIIHLRDRDGLRALLDSHAVLPGRWRGAAGRVVGPAEAVTGAATLAGWFLAPLGFRVAATATAAWYLAFSLYTASILRGGRAPACGCLGSTEPVSRTVVLRAAVLAAGSAAGAWCGSPYPLGSPPAVPLTLGAVAVVTAGVAWLLPVLIPAAGRTGRERPSPATARARTPRASRPARGRTLSGSARSDRPRPAPRPR
ncbi:hypothetical protein GCM10010123_38540 [Pilimelia anulata]|uniref:Methylamine utilisation protein MauE domain-containing protein n=1 Tax=Pilimelia anulata TaxID=53371 RepID=A0A8J3BHX0_9ACTN|nr:MauE/DoxX family redox-associated membrane protein [Pilimelia anulata]GGK04843.1 hypothetical protein GCM10010123_38540 [Pilimelia anulata]